ncbi:hypothetical protein HK097_004898 [Rhizophlyctis rosea]|uniref:PX domain-containing protein n=1 Tax=Rhizophlyctis rosea TaxID=64517 RepID=A0AAD5SFV5_9FUNG|nr:hypothetical protein HK097_004898 [Rhizophlyctis rosea]
MFSYFSKSWGASPTTIAAAQDSGEWSESEGSIASSIDPSFTDSDTEEHGVGEMREKLSISSLLQDSEDGLDWQKNYDPGRPRVQGMPSLFMAKELVGDEELKRLKTAALRARLMELTLAREFVRAYGKNATCLTASPLIRFSERDTSFRNAKPHDLRRAYSTLAVEGPHILPPLTRAIYARFVRGMPIFYGLGPGYVEELDEAVEKCFLDFVSKWMKATKFDVLVCAHDGTGPAASKRSHVNIPYQGFTRFYGSLLSHIKNEAWCNGTNAPLTTPLYPALIAWQRAAQPGGGSFRLAKRHRAHNAPADSELLIQYRESKLQDFIEAWRTFLKCAVACLKDLAEIRKVIEKEDEEDDLETEYPWAEALLRKIRGAKGIDDLPTIYVECFEAILNVLAITIDNTLDDTEWRHKFAAIYQGIPVTMIVTSMRIFNPIPFMERVIKIFCWRPPGGLYSLLQRIGALVCAISKTTAGLQAFDTRLPLNRRTSIEEAVKRAYTTPGKGPISSQDSPEKVAEMLKDAKVPHADEVELLFAKLVIRKFEKEAFVDALASDDVTRLVVHMCKSLPPILSEIWQCTDFAKLFSKFFDTIPLVLSALKPYDSYNTPDTLPPATVRKEMVRNVAKSLRPFFDLFYTFLQTLAGRDTAGPAGLHAMIDWVIKESIATNELEGGRMSIMDFAKGVDFVDGKDEKVWRDVEMVIELMEKGIDERVWPAMEHLEGDVLKVGMGAAVREFIGGSEDGLYVSSKS